MKSLIRKIAERIYLSYARAHAPREALDFSECLAQAVTALVLMPAVRREQEAAALQFLDELQQLFPETHFTVLAEANDAARLAPNENLQVLTFNVEDVAFYGLPKKNLQDTVRARHFDVVFDLHERFDLAAACLCLASDARLRVALQHPKRDSLYHFQVRVAEHYSLELKYDSLLKYLTCFKILSHAPDTDLIAA
jgi:ADP-heptose:LPS heptosyltransferase